MSLWVVALAALIGSSMVQAEEYPGPFHADLTATDGTKVQFEFAVNQSYGQDFGGCGLDSSSVYRRSQGLKVTVRVPGAQVQERVQLVFKHEEAYGHCHGSYGPSIERVYDLRPVANGVFEADLQQAPLFFEDLQNVKFELKQQVSVVVNDDWKTDPVNGTHDFKLSLDQAFLSQVGWGQ